MREILRTRKQATSERKSNKERITRLHAHYDESRLVMLISWVKKTAIALLELKVGTLRCSHPRLIPINIPIWYRLGESTAMPQKEAHRST